MYIGKYNNNLLTIAFMTLMYANIMITNNDICKPSIGTEWNTVHLPPEIVRMDDDFARQVDEESVSNCEQHIYHKLIKLT